MKTFRPNTERQRGASRVWVSVWTVVGAAAMPVGTVAQNVPAVRPPVRIASNAPAPPFTFVVPLQLRSIHDSVRRIAVRCRVTRNRGVVGGAGTTVLDAGAVLDVNRDYTGNVTVPVTMNAGEDAALMHRYDCGFALSNSDNGPLPARWSRDLALCHANNATACWTLPRSHPTGGQASTPIWSWHTGTANTLIQAVRDTLPND